MKYNPGFLSEEDLIKSFVVRGADLDSVVEVIRENTGESNQHVLVIGPRGSGKTTLLHRVAAEIRRESDLSECWYPLIFAEESYEVTCAGEFWLEAICQLGIATGNPQWEETHAELRREPDNKRLETRALTQLLDFADSQGKRVILLVENLNMLTEQFDHADEWTLRHALLNEPRLMLIASATSRFDAIDHEGRAFFEVFRKIQLEPLSSEECVCLWNAVTGQSVTQDRIRPMQILTGGNPRLFTIVASFGATRSLLELMQNLTQLVDDHTEYFKSHLDGLPPKERKVYLALVELWSDATAREVAEAARMDVNSTSSLLRRLIDRGAVVSEKRGRKMLYRTAERMYNIYYLMRRRGSSPSSRVDAAVRFMVGFYAPGELAMLTKQIAIEGAGLVPEMREDHHRAFRFLFERAPDNAQRAAMLSSAPSEFIESSGIPESLEQLRSVISGKADRESPSPQGQAGPSRGWFARLQDLAANGDPRASAQKVLAEIAEADDESLEALVIMGPCLASLDRNEEAEQVYRKLITLAPDSDRAWGMFGVLLHEKLDRPEEAEAAYRKAIAFGPDFVEPRLALGRLLHELGRPEEAEAACRKAIDLAPEVARTWAQLGWLLHDKLDRYEEAEAAYRKAIDLAPDLAQTWAALGWLLHERLDRYEEAEEAYRKAIDLAPEFAQTWAQLGWLLHERLDRYEEAEAAYRKAIDLAPESPQVSLQLGWLLHQKLDRYEEAEAAYSRAIDLSPALVQARLLLGSLLHDKLDRYEEAEAAYRKAIALSPDSAPGWVVLGTLLDEKLDRYEEAEAAYRKAIQLGVETAPLWTQLGRLLHEKLDCLGDAEVAYRRAIEIKPSWDEAWTGLYSLVVGQPGRGAEAIEITEQAFTTLGRTAANLNRFAWVHRLSDSLDDVARGIAWAREAIGSSETDSERLHATGTLASLLCRSGEVDEALELAARWLDGMDETPIVDLTDLIVSLAAAGPVEPVLTMLRDSRHAERAEPLVVALEMFGGVETRAPTEIVQVGEDIVERIRKEQAGLPSLKKA